jgi:hypothetical protein
LTGVLLNSLLMIIHFNFNRGLEDETRIANLHSSETSRVVNLWNRLPNPVETASISGWQYLSVS